MSVRTAHSVRDGEKFNTDATLVVVSCSACHIKYAIPQSLYDAARAWPMKQRRGWTLHCPVGHGWGYAGRNLIQEARAAREEAAVARADADQAHASASAHRGAATRARNERDRVRKRAAAGVCPCCNRTFKALARHMKSQHPDFDPESNEPSDAQTSSAPTSKE